MAQFRIFTDLTEQELFSVDANIHVAIVTDIFLTVWRILFVLNPNLALTSSDILVKYYIKLLFAKWARVFSSGAPIVNALVAKEVVTAIDPRLLSLFDLFYANDASLFLFFFFHLQEGNRIFVDLVAKFQFLASSFMVVSTILISSTFL